MKDIRKNFKGIDITDTNMELTNPDFGKGGEDKHGNPLIDWSFLRNADNNGFDVDNKEENGSYIMEIVLPEGTEIIRYGLEFGKYTAPKGTDYNNLSLPYKKETVPYYEYRVIKNLRVECVVNRGKVAPGFDSPGGAVQYHHHLSMRDSVREKILERLKP